MINKFEKLYSSLKKMSELGICIAFSGGIDSLLLLFLCKDLNITAITFHSQFQTDDETEYCINFCKKYNIKHIVLKINLYNDKIIINNPKDRCYHCKKKLFSEIKKYAQKNNIKYIIDGTNADDIKVYRPGLKALEELNIISPFVRFNISKKEIRNYAKKIGLNCYNKPSIPCIATRFPYNTKLNSKLIETVIQGENILKNFGFYPNRLRIHNNIARIEIEKKQFKKFIIQKDIIILKLKEIGLKYITLDIEGIRSGSMDE